MKSLFPTLLRAANPDILIDQVQAALLDGKDLHTSLFVSDGLLCQFVIPSVCHYEYRLIVADDLNQLEDDARGLSMIGFGFMFNTVLWDGKLVQWMQRVKESDSSVKKLKFALLDDPTVDPAHRADELQLVEDVHEVLRLVPYESVEYASTVPFPLVLNS